MGRRSNSVARKDAKIKLEIEEYAKGMGLKRSSNAKRKDAQNKLKMEECASRMGQR